MSAHELLLDYASGALHPAGALLASTHVAMRPSAARTVSAYEAIGGALIDDAEPVALSTGALNRALKTLEASPVARIAAPDAALDPLAMIAPDQRSAIAWRSVLPGMDRFELNEVSTAEATASLVRLRAGRTIPEHGHTGREMTLVLDGAFEDASGRYEPGDIAIADESVEHRPSVDAAGDCVCLTVEEGALTVRRPVSELVRYFLQFVR